MFSFFFLFSESISLERIEWISNFIRILFTTEKKKTKLVDFFLTGEGLYSLFDERYSYYWKRLFSYQNVNCYVDSNEMQMIGIEEEIFTKEFASNIKLSDKIEKIDFWNLVIDRLVNIKTEPNFGFMQFESPYMHRTSVYAINSLKAALNIELKPELYSYMDGLHLGHADQNPSEFLNIGEELNKLSASGKEKGLDFLMYGCSRCGMARGYMKDGQKEGYYDTEDTIPQFLQCNLNKIIERFEENHFIITPSFASIKNISRGKNSQISPPILIFITHGPYASEWTFGGLSFAMACANHEIMTKVVFIEEGIYSLIGNHNISDDEKIFNMQDLISSILDMDYLSLFAYLPSLEMRGLSISKSLEEIELIGNEKLYSITMNLIKNSNSNHIRIIFF